MSDLPESGGATVAAESSTLRAGDVSDKLAKRKIASLIDEALEFFRTTARTNDYFTGYSLAEVITERLALIGEEADDESTAAFSGAKRTLISRLNYLQTQLIGEDGKGGVVQDALEIDGSDK